MIAKETIQEILETARVEEVVGDFVSLKKRGVNYIGLCPFHNEKTPSFTVSPAKGIYKCFGCGKGGNPVNFVMDHEHYTYPEALRFLASKYNIEIDEEEPTPAEIEARSEQESLYNANAFARKFFSDTLFNTEEGRAVGLSYFKERDFNEETIKEFQLGYCPDGWRKFTEKALEEGYKLEHLQKAGLTIVKEDRKFDRFSARVIFPIHNLTGKVIGFGGRILSAEKSKAKYVNSPESEIYNKSKSLYGIFFAKNDIVKHNNCFLVEGYTDVISLHQAGIKNVVASSGTSLTVEQIKLIKRYTPNITILFDGDEAGLKASFRGIDMILEQGMNVKIVMFPEGEDPDSYVRSHRTAEVMDYITDKARDFISFKTDLLSKESSHDPIKKATVVKEVVQSIARVPDGIYRNFYVKECSDIMDVPEQTLMNELNKLLREKFKKDRQFEPQTEDSFETPAEFTKEPQLKIDPTDTEVHEQQIIRLLLNYGDETLSFTRQQEKREEIIETSAAAFIVNDILTDELNFKHPVYQKIFDEFSEGIEKGNIPDEHYFTAHPEKEVSSTAVELLLSPYELSPNWAKNKIFVKSEFDNLKEAIISSVLSFKAKKVYHLILENQKSLREANSEEDMIILLQKHIKLKEISRKINSELSRIITR